LKDESFKGTVNNVLVIGVFKELVNRRTYEDELVKKLGAHGVNARPSYKVFGSGKLPDKKAIVSKMDELNMETVLITAIFDKESREGWYQNYSHRYNAFRYEYDIYRVETKLYDMRSEGLIWSALSETVVFDPDINRDVKEIKVFIDVMVKKLSDDGMLE
jgi:hypothetical protein